jgi:hypothetical protein
LAWPYRGTQARRTQPSTRVFPLFASTQGSAGFYKLFVTVTWTVILSECYSPCHAFREVYPGVSTHSARMVTD